METLGIPQSSTGDMMRSERASGSDLGQKFDSYMKDGKLVPDALVLELFEKRLKQSDASDGAIFDGFPRTVAQAEALDSRAGLRRRVRRRRGAREVGGADDRRGGPGAGPRP